MARTTVLTCSARIGKIDHGRVLMAFCQFDGLFRSILVWTWGMMEKASCYTTAEWMPVAKNHPAFGY
ncbi:hypothetical protein [Amycolatopsis vastitatis]|uniref:hypothetical protein n=1 Tax=Amycolatopsis vastitatis TaxID=1905142 RepID=UPI0013042219|nr:hypothetical protein [Amycolatopsis vastitatis]